jgi:hypothetical protein
MPFNQRTMLVAKESFTGLLNGSEFSVFQDHTRIWSNHPAARRWPLAFEPIRVTDESPGDPEVRADLSVGQLRQLAKERGVALGFGMTKEAIAAAIADAAPPDENGEA